MRVEGRMLVWVCMGEVWGEGIGGNKGACCWCLGVGVWMPIMFLM